jgi:hypothetical protein
MRYGGYLQKKSGLRRKNELRGSFMNLKLRQLYLLLRCPNENMMKRKSHTDQMMLHNRGAIYHLNSYIATFISNNRMIDLIIKWWNNRQLKQRILKYKKKLYEKRKNIQ